MVIATQNELGYVGTYPLPEAQLDRFLMRISLGYPSPEQELAVIKNRINHEPIKEVQAVCSSSDVIACIKAAKEVVVEHDLCKYIVTIVTATRNHPYIRLGASPRASVAMLRAAQAFALLQGRSYVRPEDIQFLAPYVLAHRLRLRQDVYYGKLTPEYIIQEIIRSHKAPYRREAAQ
jgi:MoxR-like ATPase